MSVLSEKVFPSVPFIFIISDNSRGEDGNTFIKVYNGLVLLTELMVTCGKVIQIIGCDVIDIYKMKILFPLVRLVLPWPLDKLIEYKLLNRIKKA